MELLENRLLMDALCCLRNDITPLKYDSACSQTEQLCDVWDC